MMAVGLAHYLVVSAILFTLGILGIFLNRKNIIVILMSVELILLVAMIGAIVLTLRGKTTTKRQDIAKQVARAGSVNLRKVPSGASLGQIGIERPPLEAPAGPKPKQVEHAHGDGGHH